MPEVRSRCARVRVFPIAAAAACAVTMVLVPSASAQGDMERAQELFVQGQRQFDEERWEEAAELWLEAYETYPAANILFHVGEALRKHGDCEDALGIYRRFVDRDPESGFREEADEHIETLERECGPERDPTTDGDGDGDVVGTDEGTGTEIGDDTTTTTTGPHPPPTRAGPAAPTRLVAYADVGPAFISMGDLDVPVLTSFRAGIAYPLDAGPVEIQAGATSSFAPVPWSSDDESGTALMTTVLANAGARFEIAHGFFARGELGLGALIFSGIGDAGSPFIEEGLAATGALSMFHIRAQLAAEYEVTRNFVVSLSPVVISHSPRREGLRENIGGLTRFEMLAGLGLRL